MKTLWIFVLKKPAELFIYATFKKGRHSLKTSIAGFAKPATSRIFAPSLAEAF